MRENSTAEDWQKVLVVLNPPETKPTADGAPAWYGDDDDAWAEWERAARA